MTPQTAEAQAVREVYALFRLAAARRQPVAATYDGRLRLLCPHVLGRKSGRLHVFCAISLGEIAESGLARAPDEVGVGVASPWRDSAKSSCARRHGTPSHAPRGRPCIDEVDFDADAQSGDKTAERAVRKLPQQQARQNDA